MTTMTIVPDKGLDQRADASLGEPRAAATFGAVLNGLAQLRAWCDRTVIVKYGGAIMGLEDLRASFAHDVARLHAAGVHLVVVHGGGHEIDALMRRLGKTPRWSGGLRVTDEETMELVEMVLVGKINPEIVGLINRHGGHAVGLNGKDDDLIVAHRRPPIGCPAANAWISGSSAMSRP